jgi:glycosyltransferase involved in cell wall biosynthesis
MPKVSVITPCFNSARYVGSTIDSVQAQTLRDWEHVVVDDGSTDDSAAVIAAHALPEARLRLIRQPNRGVSSARNAGFRACGADSEYLLFLDADDCLHPSMLDAMTRYLDDRPEVGMVYCEPLFIDSEGALLPNQTRFLPRYVPTRLGLRRLPDEHAETPFVSIFCLAGIIPSVTVIRRSVYESTPGWDETFGQHYEDTDVFLHVALLSKVHYSPQQLVYHRRHGSQSTAEVGKFASQELKLYEKWLTRRDLGKEDQKMVREAYRFRHGTLMPYLTACSSIRFMRGGQIGTAFRFGAAALRRYISWLAPIGRSRLPHLSGHYQ